MTENQELTTTQPLDATMIEGVLLGGDLSKLAPAQRVAYYRNVCQSIGLNYLTKPFEYITLNGKLTLYARKDATDQLRNINGVSIDDVDIVETEKQYLVKVKGHDKTGRSDVEIGVVNKTDMQGNLANAQMKAVTKAKRRLTLSLCGLGWLDETEIETIPSAMPVKINSDTGEIVESPAPENINQETGQPADAVELIDPMSQWAVKYAATEWNISDGDAAKEIAKKKLGKKVEKADFIEIVKGK